MVITICGSIAFYDEMLAVKSELVAMGHEVLTPPKEIRTADGREMSVKEYYEIRKKDGDLEDWVWDSKEKAIRAHFDKIERGDVVLILNYDKSGVANYIGANTFLEIGVAFFLRKKIFLLNPIPEIPSREEILGMKPIVINGDLNKI